MQTDKALIVVDYQNSFIPENEGGTGELGVEGGGTLSPYITQVMKETKIQGGLIVATRDWHPQNHTSFASNHPGKKVFEELNGQVLWPDHCVVNTSGSQYFSELPQKFIDHHIIKGYDVDQEMYSGFSGKEDTPEGKKLADILIEAGVKTVRIVGIATDYCIQSTAIDAVKNGFRAIIDSKGIAGVAIQSPEDTINYLEKLREKTGVQFE